MTAYRINNQGPAGAAGSSFLAWAATGYSTTGQANVNRFLTNWCPYTSVQAVEQFIIVPRGGVLKNMYARMDASYATSNVTLTIRVNGTDTSIVCAISAGNTTQTDLAHVAVVLPGDYVSCKVIQTVGDSTAVNFNVTLECAPQ